MPATGPNGPGIESSDRSWSRRRASRSPSAILTRAAFSTVKPWTAASPPKRHRPAPIFSCRPQSSKSAAPQSALYECRPRTAPFPLPIVIIADGVESRLARFLGWNTALSLADVESCAFCRATSPAHRPGCLHLLYRHHRCAGRLCLDFPAGQGRSERGPRHYRQPERRRKGAGVPGTVHFGRSFPEHRSATTTAAEFRSVNGSARSFVKARFSSGDAARQVNSISGAGIHYSLFAGKLAGTVAAAAFMPDGAVDLPLACALRNRMEKTLRQAAGPLLRAERVRA